MIVVNSRSELREVIDQMIEERGLRADLNDIDVSRISNMDYLFESSLFDGDISKWDVSKVEYMNRAFDELLIKAPNWYKGQTVKSDI